jgi:uncharacterized protein
VLAAENRALAACAAFGGDVLVVESEHDDIVPHPTAASYLASFERARSITHRVLRGADHGLSDPVHQQEYTSLLVRWATEMVLGMRAGDAAVSGPPPGRSQRSVAEVGEEVLEEAIGAR